MIHHWDILLYAILGIAAGPITSKIPATWLRRTIGWSVLIILVSLTSISLNTHDPILRMVGICCVLLGSMKGIVYAEWSRPHYLSLIQYLVFSCLWFGMDPGTFRRRRPKLTWLPDIGVGFALMIAGIVGTFFVWRYEWHHILLMFVPMSLGFHFGALRILKGILRRAGYPVRTLFPNVLTATSLGDFWSYKWNIGYSQMMQRTVGRPITNISNPSLGLFAIFVVSGLLHELAITLPVQAGYGLPTLYFTGHGLLTLLERKWNHPIGKLPTLLIVALPIGILFPEPFQTQIIERFLTVFDWIFR